MRKRLAFASIVASVTALALAQAACSGTDATIGADPADANGGTDGTTSGNDSAVSTDSATGTNDGSVGVDASPPPRRDAGPRDAAVVDAAQDGGLTDASVDAAPPPYDGGPLNGCTPGNYTDRSNGGQVQRTITFPVGAPGSFTYSVPCMHIKATQTVQLDGNFTFHPLAPLGGDVPTPFTVVNTGLTTQVTFNTPGTYGFHCQTHATMIGSIEVVN
jgi:hypothetical protein